MRYESNKLSSKLRKEHLQLPLWRNKFGKMKEEYYSIKIFNELPKETKTLNTYNAIKRELLNEWV